MRLDISIDYEVIISTYLHLVIIKKWNYYVVFLGEGGGGVSVSKDDHIMLHHM